MTDLLLSGMVAEVTLIAAGLVGVGALAGGLAVWWWWG